MKFLFYAVLLSLFMLGATGCTTVQERKAIASPDAPAAIGPYSQAIRVGNLLFLSGQIPLDPKTNQISGTTIEEQTHRVMGNLTAVLAANNMSMANIVNTTVYLRDLNDFAAMNKVYGSYFGANPPARATIQAGRLPRDVAIEISAIAAE